MNRHSLILASVAAPTSAAATAAAAAAMTSYYIMALFFPSINRWCGSVATATVTDAVGSRADATEFEPVCFHPLPLPTSPVSPRTPCMPCTKSCADNVSLWTEVGPPEIRFILFFLRQTGIALGAKTLTLPLARTRIFCLAAVRNSPRPSIVSRSYVTRLAPSTSRLTTTSRLWIHGRCLRYIRTSRIVDAGGIRADRWTCTQILAHTIWSNRKIIRLYIL